MSRGPPCFPRCMMPSQAKPSQCADSRPLAWLGARRKMLRRSCAWARLPRLLHAARKRPRRISLHLPNRRAARRTVAWSFCHRPLCWRPAGWAAQRVPPVPPPPHCAHVPRHQGGTRQFIVRVATWQLGPTKGTTHSRLGLHCLLSPRRLQAPQRRRDGQAQLAIAPRDARRAQAPRRARKHR